MHGFLVLVEEVDGKTTGAGVGMAATVVGATPVSTKLAPGIGVVVVTGAMGAGGVVASGIRVTISGRGVGS